MTWPVYVINIVNYLPICGSEGWSILYRAADRMVLGNSGDEKKLHV
jgi:hypothetical protein